MLQAAATEFNYQTDRPLNAKLSEGCQMSQMLKEEFSKVCWDDVVHYKGTVLIASAVGTVCCSRPHGTSQRGNKSPLLTASLS